MSKTLAPFMIYDNMIGRVAASLKGKSCQYESSGENSIKNVRFALVSGDAIEVSYEIDSPSGDLSAWVSAYVDGVFSCKTQGDSLVIGGLSSGRHSLLIRIEQDSEAGLWTGFDTSSGARPLIDWTAFNQGNEIKVYNIYFDSGTGTISFDSPWAVVDKIEASHKELAAPDSGSGAGTLSSHGVYNGPYSYCDFQIIIDTAGAINEYSEGATFKWRKLYWDNEVGGLVSSDYTALIPIQFSDTRYYLEHGISVSFNSESVLYEEGDGWSVPCECRRYYQHDAQLEDGNYQACIRASDGVNESDNTDPQVVFTVSGPPPDPSDLAIAYQEESRAKITGTAPDVADLSKIVICSNGGVDGDVPDKRFLHSDWYEMGYLQYQPESEFTAAPGEAFEYVTGVLTPGKWEFVVMALDTDGNFSDGVEFLEIEMRGSPAVYVVSSPAPTGLDAVQLAGGSIRLDFNLYGRLSDTDRAVSANVYHNSGSGAVDYATVVGTVNSTLRNSWNKASATVSGLTNGIDYTFGVRAVSATGFEEGNIETVTCRADASAPLPPNVATVELSL